MALDRAPRGHASLRLLLLLAFIVGCGELNDESFNEEVIACEEAVAHLENCCGRLDGEVSCTYIPATYAGWSEEDRSLLSEGDYPDISFKTGACYRALSCDQIKEHRLCEMFRGTVPWNHPCP